jgi:hypothetical protein
MIERSIIITDGNLNTVKELVVIWDHRISWLCQFGIKLGERHYLMISRDRFNRIIQAAEANGLLVFDYRTFD